MVYIIVTCVLYDNISVCPEKIKGERRRLRNILSWDFLDIQKCSHMSGSCTLSGKWRRLFIGCSLLPYSVIVLCYGGILVRVRQSSLATRQLSLQPDPVSQDSGPRLPAPRRTGEKSCQRDPA